MADEPVGALFTDVYVPRGEALRDDARMRHRLYVSFEEIRSSCKVDFIAAIEGRLGIVVPYRGGYHDWRTFFHSVDIADLLNCVTVIFQSLQMFDKQFRLAKTQQWTAAVARIFDEQNSSYRTDAAGGVRFRYDAAMEAARQSTVGNLNAAGMKHIAGLLDEALQKMDAVPPDLADAIRGVFFSAEELFKLNFPAAARLVAFEVDAKLAPIAMKLVADDKAGTEATKRLVASFKEWVGACHEYRHAKGEAEPKPPPLQLALLLVSQGISWIRWLAPLK